MLAFVKKISTTKLRLQDEEIVDLFSLGAQGGSPDPPGPPPPLGYRPHQYI